MSGARSPHLSPRMKQGVDELKVLILQRYPEARFRVTRSPEDKEIIHLETLVDVADQDEVMDVVVDRMMELQIEEGLPIYVITMRPLERVRS